MAGRRPGGCRLYGGGLPTLRGSGSAGWAWPRRGRGQPPKNPREAEYECRRRANAGEVLDPLRVHVRRRRMTIEGASAAAGRDKSGNLLGFATTDEVGSVVDMTKKDEKRKQGRVPVEAAGQGRRLRRWCGWSCGSFPLATYVAEVSRGRMNPKPFRTAQNSKRLLHRTKNQVGAGILPMGLP